MQRASRVLPGAAAFLLLGLLPLLVSARPAPAVLEGRVIAANGGAVGALLVLLRHGGSTDSAAVGPDGRFSLPAPRAAMDVELTVYAPEGVEPRFHPSVGVVRAEDAADGIRVVLLPRSWSIRTGRHAGRRVEISPGLAFAPACSGCSSFFRPGLRDPSSGRLAPTPTWPDWAFPLRVAFTGEVPGPGVAPRDSVAFWRIVGELEEDFGRDLLLPARYAETLTGERGAPEDVILVEFDPRLRRVGWGSTISQRGDIIFGAIRVRSAGEFSGRDGARIVKHELLHTLGVGHTCSWRSVMAQLGECSARSADSPTPEDVAYFAVLARARELQRVLGAQLGLEAALWGEQLRGAPPSRR